MTPIGLVVEASIDNVNSEKPYKILEGFTKYGAIKV